MFLSLLGAMLLGPLSSGEAHAGSDYEAKLLYIRSDELVWYWGPELAGTGALVAGYFLAGDVSPRNIGGVAELRGIDAVKTPRWSPGAAFASDLLGNPLTMKGLNLPVLSVIGVGVWGGVRDGHLGSGLMHSMIVLESYGADIAVTEALKLAFSRPRPYTSQAFQDAEPDIYAGEEIQHDLSEEGHWDAYKSMPSGHTSGTAAYSFSIATLVARDAASRGGPGWVAPVAYGGAGALTAAVGTLRVVAGKHHPTDVIVGGVLGAGIGTGLTWAHTRGGPQLALGTSEAGPTLTYGGVW